MANNEDNSDLAPIRSDQLNLDLFSLDGVIDKNYSNVLEVYDLAGKFLYDKERKFLDTLSAEDSAFQRIIKYRGQDIKFTITAATIERKVNGKSKRVFVYPGAREEIIEFVLRKFASEGRAEAFQVNSGENRGQQLVGLKFTLYEVYNELKRVKKSYSYSEISEALEIMNNSGLKIENDEGSVDLSAPFFPIKATAEKGQKKDRDNFVCFHPMVTDAILTMNFRRHNYLTALSFKGQYTRMVYLRLCMRWVQASPDNPYKIKLSTLVDATKTPYSKLYQDKRLFSGVFDELIEKKILERCEAEPRKEGKKIVDWLFVLYPTAEFTKQVAANNKVASRNKHLQNVGSEAAETIEHES